MNLSLSKLWETWRTGKPGVLQSMGHKKLDITERLNNNNTVEMIITISLIVLYHHIQLQNVQYKLLHMLYILSPWHLFYTWKLVPLDPLHPFAQPLSPLATIVLLSKFIQSLLLFVSIVKFHIYVYSYFSGWLISLSIFSHSRSVHVVSNGKISF